MRIYYGTHVRHLPGADFPPCPCGGAEHPGAPAEHVVFTPFLRPGMGRWVYTLETSASLLANFEQENPWRAGVKDYVLPLALARRFPLTEQRVRVRCTELRAGEGPGEGRDPVPQPVSV